MAIAYVGEVGKATNNSSTVTVPVTRAPSLGNCLIVRLGFRASGAVTISSISDTQGNFYSIDSKTDAPSGHSAIAISKPGAQLTTADSITVTLSGSAGNGACVIVDEFSGLTTTIDKSAGGSGSTTTRGAGTTAATTNANDLIVAAYAGNGQETSFTPGAGFSNFTTPFENFGTTAFVEGQYQIVSATGAYSAPATGGFSGTTEGAMVVYEGASGPNTFTQTLAASSVTAPSVARAAAAAKALAQASSPALARIAELIKSPTQPQTARISSTRLRFLVLSAAQASAATVSTKVTQFVRMTLTASSATVATIGRLFGHVFSAGNAQATTLKRAALVTRISASATSARIARAVSAFRTASSATAPSLRRSLPLTKTTTQAQTASVLSHKPGIVFLTATASALSKPIMWFLRKLRIVAASLGSETISTAATGSSGTLTPASTTSQALPAATETTESITPATMTTETIVPDECA